LEASQKNPKLRPGLKYRLDSKPKIIDLNISGHFRENDNTVLSLDLGIIDYGLFAATNSAARENPEFAKYLMEQGKKFYDNEFAYFASPVGNCAVVESLDNKIALIKKADEMHEYPGFYDTPGGHANPLKHSFDSKGQFDAIKDEVSEEIKIPRESIEEAYLIGITVNLENFRKPDLLFYLRTGLPSSRMDPNEEVSRLEKLAKDELFENWKKGSYNIVPPSEALLFCYFSLEKGYDLSFVK
jgi:8-oxo-dGTP pyrophosphatase MutT (NUDIX family)